MNDRRADGHGTTTWGTAALTVGLLVLGASTAAAAPVRDEAGPGDGVIAPTSIDQFATQLGISTVCADGRVGAAVYSTMKAGTSWSIGDGLMYIGGERATITRPSSGEEFGYSFEDFLYLESVPELWLMDDAGGDGVTIAEGDVATVRYAIGDNQADGIPVSTTLDCSAPGAVFRFWSPQFDNAHFFTTNFAEAAHIIATDGNWQYEGVAFRGAPLVDGTCTQGEAVHRFYSQGFRSHFFTKSESEKAHIVANDRNWTYEGVAYCAAASPAAGTTPLHRFWSPAFGKHFFTADQGEADHIRANDRNWTYEGVAYHVWGA